MPQQSRYVELPNGSYMEWPQGVSAEEFKAKAQRVIGQSGSPQRTAVDKMFPQGSVDSPVVIGPPHPRTGFAGAEDYIKNLKTRFEQYGDRGFAQGATENLPMTSIPEGVLRILKGLTEAPQGKLWKSTKDVVGGGLKAAEIPLSFMAPESSGKKVGKMAIEDAAKAITDAINPEAKKLGNYESELSKHLDKIMSFADKRGLKIDSPEGLWKSMLVAQKSIMSHYYEHILGPVKELPTDITAIEGYAGKSISPSSATLGDLDARLSQINAELHPKFAKGGIAGQQAVKSAEQLNSEAAAIRAVLYPKLGKVSGIGSQAVADTREAFGSLRSLAEQTKASADQARHSVNAAKNAPITINPFSGSQGKQFVADKAINALRGDPIKNAVKNAAGRLDVPRYELPEPSFSAVRSSRGAPIRGGSKAVGEVSKTTPEEIAAHLKKFKDRESSVLASRNKTLRRPIWEKLGNEPLP